MALNPIEILINARDNASGVFDRLNGKLKVIGAAIVGYFGVKAFVGIVEGAADFEQAMSRVQSATGASAEEMERLKKAAEDAGANTKYTSTEAAAALENLAKAGLSAGDAIQTLPAVLALAQAGDVDLATASEYVTKAVMGMGLAFSDAGRVADVLALGANATNTSVKGLAEALSYAAPTAQSLGLSLETTVAIIGKFADAGIDASRAGTALNSIMSQFSDPASKFRNELAAAGITTGDFNKALHELAASGTRGSKAINAVGLEAGPALKALLNQGMPALDALKAKLDGAAGSAAATAKVMEDNLKGSLNGLSSAWDTVKNVLGTPVLPVLKDGVDQLAGALRGLVADGTIAKFGESFAEAFRAAIKWARDFFDQIDFKAVVADMQAFAAQAGETFRSIGESAAMAGNAAQAAYGVMSAGTNFVLGAVYGIGAAFAGVASNIQSGLALLYDAFAKITFGEVSAAYKQAADEIRLSAGATMAASEALGEKSIAAFVSMADGAQIARNGFAGLAQSATDAKPAIDSVAAAQAAATKELEAGAAAAAAAGVATQKKASADQAAKQAADENRAAIAQLREEYAALVAGGDLQGAAEKLQEINKALKGTADAAGNSAKAAADAAAQIEAAFGRLGVTSSAALKEQAANAKRDYDTIRNAGTSTAQDVGAAFKVAAEKAIAANKGIAPSWVQAQAGARGYQVDVDAAGKSSVAAMDAAGSAIGTAIAAHGSAVGAAGKHATAVDGVARAYGGAGAAANAAANSFDKAAASKDRFDKGRTSSRGEDLAEGVEEVGSGGHQFRNKDNMTSDAKGNAQQQWIWTRGAIIDYLNQAGLDEKLSEDLAKQFVNSDGSVDYKASGAQLKWGGKHSTLSEALGKMVDYYKYTDAGKNEALNRGEFLNGPEKPGPAAAPSAARGQSSSGSGATYVSNITIPGVGSAALKFADANSQSQAEDLLRKLAQAKGAAIR